MNQRKLNLAVLGALTVAGSAGLSACTNGQDADSNGSAQAAPAPASGDNGDAEKMVASWPEASRMAAMDMIQKYGQPQEVTASMLMWKENGPWKWTKVSRETIKHDFPMSHPDLLEQAINYRAPVDKYDDLARYDGSVIVERTKGEMSARCDKEGANFLAINLANDVATGKRTAEEARTYYAAAIKRFMSSKEMDPYMQKIQFQMSGQATGDPDRAAM
ncbi:MAG: hypothetical protein H0V46_07460 [Sphingomonas sp.]|nr:hypothetical protein [Sphingomonas sp.]